MGKNRAMTSSKMADILLRHPTTTTRRANRVLYILLSGEVWSRNWSIVVEISDKASSRRLATYGKAVCHKYGRDVEISDQEYRVVKPSMVDSLDIWQSTASLVEKAFENTFAMPQCVTRSTFSIFINKTKLFLTFRPKAFINET